MALAAQSLGAMLLLIVGAGVLWSARVVRPQRLAVVLLAVLIGIGAVYVSGIVPVTRIGKETAIGQRMVAGFKSVGRGSFTWRISQDQQLLTDAMARPATGSGTWDWWRPRGMRPWGLAMLLLGQFGLIGLSLAFSSLLLPAVRAVWAMPTGDAWAARGLPLLLATLIVLTLLDALLNSFIFFPAILIAGGLAGMPRAGARVDTAGPGDAP